LLYCCIDDSISCIWLLSLPSSTSVILQRVFLLPSIYPLIDGIEARLQGMSWAMKERGLLSFHNVTIAARHARTRTDGRGRTVHGQTVGEEAEGREKELRMAMVVGRVYARCCIGDRDHGALLASWQPIGCTGGRRSAALLRSATNDHTSPHDPMTNNSTTLEPAQLYTQCAALTGKCGEAQLTCVE
jgi:hypothetical protein